MNLYQWLWLAVFALPFYLGLLRGWTAHRRSRALTIELREVRRRIGRGK